MFHFSFSTIMDAQFQKTLILQDIAPVLILANFDTTDPSRSQQRKIDSTSINGFGGAPAGGFANGTVVGDTYKILDFIGAGGMGLVYKVEHTIMHKVLALKVLKTEYLSESVWRRFLIEAQAIARLNHDNVVKIYDMNQTADGRPFYTMDLIEGESLADYLQEHKRLPAEHALPLFRQVCAGLAYAHERGIIHRDIKPGNIMLIGQGGNTGQSKIKIVDFGIAKMSNDGRQTMQGLTRPGEVFGSPLYMSPEQCLGEKLDPRSDLYSVGVTLFQALAGKPPFLGRTAMETTTMHLSQSPPTLSAVAGDLKFDARLEKLLATMLAKTPQDRYASLTEVASEMLLIEKGEVTPVSRQISGSRPAIAKATAQLDFAGATTEIDPEFINKSDSSYLKQPVVLLLVALGLVGLSTVALMMLANANRWFSSEPVRSSVKSESKSLNSSRIDNNEDFVMGDRADPKLLPKAHRFVAQRTKPYSTIEKVNGTEMRIFSFPEKFSIGKIVSTVDGFRKEREATGEVSCLKSDRTDFRANEITQAVPELLKFFQTNELNAVEIHDIKPRAELLSSYLARMKSLTALNLSGCALLDRDLLAFDTLPNLRNLQIDDSGVTGAALAKSKLLPKLQTLSIVGIDNCAPVLVALDKTKNIKTLFLDRYKLNQSEITDIAKLTSLQYLSLKWDGLTDSNLAKLTALKNLTQLNVYGNEITEASLYTLAKFPRLQDRALPVAKKGDADWGQNRDANDLKL